MGTRVIGSTVRAITRNKEPHGGQPLALSPGPVGAGAAPRGRMGLPPIGIEPPSPRGCGRLGARGWTLHARRKHARASYTRCFGRLPGC